MKSSISDNLLHIRTRCVVVTELFRFCRAVSHFLRRVGDNRTTEFVLAVMKNIRFSI